MRTCSRLFISAALIAMAVGMISAQQRSDTTQGADGFRFRRTPDHHRYLVHVHALSKARSVHHHQAAVVEGRQRLGPRRGRQGFRRMMPVGHGSGRYTRCHTQ